MVADSLVETQVAQVERMAAEDVLRWAVDEYHPNIALASSFGAEDMVLLDMLATVAPHARIFTLDTGRLPQETYDLIDRVRMRYNIQIEVYFPQAALVEAMVREKGVNLFLNSVADRRQCCFVRKVEPLGRALNGLRAWITGLRREQSVTRTAIGKLERDEEHGGIWKVNPLADWTRDQVWEYIRRRHVPYNALHDRGYPSLGCACCTRAVKPGQDERAGRWWWENPEHKECGLHARGHGGEKKP
jgi:phosphoadenosine phosphosulfate reductase